MGNSRRLNKYEKEVGGVTLVLRQGWASACHRKPVNKFGQENSGEQDFVQPLFWREVIFGDHLSCHLLRTLRSLSHRALLLAEGKQHENL
eukprot:scaffold9213_cov125-Skeletonema_dohrnii-CCMP3373.AAC.4